MAGPEHAAPGIEFEAIVVLVYDVDYSPLEPGARFEVLEGPRTVATGRVVSRFEDDKDWRAVTMG